MLVFYADTPEEARLAIAEELIRRGESEIKAAEARLERFANKLPQRTIGGTKTEALCRLEAGRVLRLEGYTLKNNAVIRATEKVA